MQTSGAYNAMVGGDSLSGSYQGTSTLEAFEKITVPAGTFDTIRVRAQIYLWDDDILITETIWFAENVGVVKALSDGDTAVMSGTNVIDTVPDSFWFKAKRDVGLKSVVTSNTITTRFSFR